MNTNTTFEPDDIIVADNGGGNYERPPEGEHQAVLVDIIDLGEQSYEFKGQKITAHKIKLVWQLECEEGQRRQDGKRFEIGRQFTRSLAEKSNLRPFLENWRGAQFTAEELKGFSLKKLYGVNGRLFVLHETKGDKTYANVRSVSKWNTKYGPTIEPENYVRQQAKQQAQAAPQQNAPATKTVDPDDVIPF
jgi:hypothetical protein